MHDGEAVLGGQCDDPASHLRAATQFRSGKTSPEPVTDHAREGTVDVRLAPDVERLNHEAQLRRRPLDCGDVGLGPGEAEIREKRHARHLGRDLLEDLQALGLDLDGDGRGESRDVATRSSDALNQPLLHRQTRAHHDDRNRLRRAPCRQCRRRPHRNQHVDVRSQQLVDPGLPDEPGLQLEVLPLDVPEALELVTERIDPSGLKPGRGL